MEISIVQIIKNSINLFKKYKKQIIMPFVIIFLLSLTLSVMSNDLNKMNEEITNTSQTNPDLAISRIGEDLGFSILIMILSIIFGFINQMLEFSVYTPIQETMKKTKISNWKTHFKKQFINTLKQLVISIIIFITLILGIVLILLGAFLNDLITFGILGGICILIYLILLFVTMFSSYYIVLKNSGITKSINLSYKTVKNNFKICLSFILVWGLILLTLSLLYIIIIFLTGEIPTYLYYISIFISALFINPILLISYIGLGDKLVK
jgi:uncharacterized membrane protein